MAAGFAKINVDDLQTKYEAFTTRLCRGKTITKVATFSEFLLGELLFKASFVYMGQAGREEDRSKAVPGICEFFRNLHCCVSTGSASKLFPNIIKERTLAAMHIAMCGLPEESRSLDDFPRRFTHRGVVSSFVAGGCTGVK